MCSCLCDICIECFSNVVSLCVGVVWEVLLGYYFYGLWSKSYVLVGGDVIGLLLGVKGNGNDLGF